MVNTSVPIQNPDHSSRGVHSQEMPGTEVQLGWVAIFELRYGDGSQFLPSGIKIGIDFQTPV